METNIKDYLENGEKLLWRGKAASGKVMDKTYSMLYCLVCLICYGFTAALIIMGYKAAAVTIMRYAYRNPQDVSSL